MDLSKAFDCLPHQLLMAKLKAYGVCGKSCALIWSYLSGRNQRVRVGSSTSEWLLLTKGVPQGSVLGPVLFNIFINDLYAAISTCDLYNYADDNTISACCDSKQQVIDTLMAESTTAMKWFEANMMQANPGKFQAIILKEPSDSRTTLTVGNTIITTDDSVKLLGVHLDRHLDFNKQIKELSPTQRTTTPRETPRPRGTNGHLQGFHHDPLQLLPPVVAFLWCYKHQETRTHTIPCTQICVP